MEEEGPRRTKKDQSVQISTKENWGAITGRKDMEVEQAESNMSTLSCIRLLSR